MFYAYEKPLRVDQLASDIEDFLTVGSAFPILGTVPAVFKILFGITQTVCAASALVASTFFLMTDPAQEIWVASFRHILHGLSNILAGIIQAIPLIGSLGLGVQLWRNAAFSDRTRHYTNDQSHKFFGYKSLIDTSWKIADLEEIGEPVSGSGYESNKSSHTAVCSF